MRRNALITVVALVAACGGSSATGTSGNTTPTIPGSTSPVATTSVSIANTAFAPSNIEVASGAVVTFTNNDAITHNVTFANSAIGTTGNYTSGAKTLTMPAAAGAYTFKCTIHALMTGTVTVK
ncbi:MAG: plastocyanin/azurin family copper-binding protein [Gemmatimonadota bacterium]|nr:plastocyanin/azurin family copper-binding protein [Gemmatimonadota bacterium]